nr:PREDICTED: uncharacterized protein LOC102348897 isoform X2 [Latimeria chalumnae]|eukprot:XP_014342318.1 PREDICTED: uncharacterized protein LOC102348897 isoform X2 [Latimeria chalumnae]
MSGPVVSAGSRTGEPLVVFSNQRVFKQRASSSQAQNLTPETQILPKSHINRAILIENFSQKLILQKKRDEEEQLKKKAFDTANRMRRNFLRKQQQKKSNWIKKDAPFHRFLQLQQASKVEEEPETQDDLSKAIFLIEGFEVE